MVWVDAGFHASESVGSQQLMEMIYQMVSRTDPETMRFLNDTILTMCIQANAERPGSRCQLAHARIGESVCASQGAATAQFPLFAIRLTTVSTL